MKGFWKDISLVEILIIGGVLATLLALTVPNFRLFSCRAKQSDVKFNLGQIYATQKLYHDEFGYYATLNHLIKSNRLKLTSNYYTYTLPIVGKDFFLVQAEVVGTHPLAGDAWSIDQNNNLTSVFNTCTQG